MIIPINTVAPIIYDELYARNAIGLQGVTLCPFLNTMDEYEERLQQRRIQSPPHLKDTYKFTPRAGAAGILAFTIGGFVTGGIGFTAILLGLGGLALGGDMVPELKAAEENLSARILRVAQKIDLIRQARFNTNHPYLDARQLELAKAHFERVLSNYQRKLTRENRLFYDSDSDSDSLIGNINITIFQRD